MVASMIDHVGSGEMNESIVNTFSTIALAFVLAIGCGALVGALVHRSSRLRDVVDPLLASYYSVPTFIFYPLLVAMLGLGKAPLVVLGVLSAAPAVMISTLSGLDSVSPVLLKLAWVHRLSPARTLWWIVLPAALPRLFSGFKLALSYALIGVIAGEFILSADRTRICDLLRLSELRQPRHVRPDAVCSAGSGHRQRDTLRLGGAAGAPPIDGMSDLAFEKALSSRPSRGVSVRSMPPCSSC